MKKLLAILIIAVLACTLAFTLTACNPDGTSGGDIAILVPNADHGWTGAVMNYAQEYAAKINAEGKYSAKVITSSDSNNQIAQLEDIVANKNYKSVVILPYDNMLENAMLKLANSGIPFVMFDRVIDTVAANAVSSVKGDNEGIGAATAARFVKKGLQPGDKILVLPGDKSSVPEARNKGFKDYLINEAGWTEKQFNDNVTFTADTGWSRATGKQLFTDWITAKTVDEINQVKWVFTHDDEIGMGILEALKETSLDAAKKAAFLRGDVSLASSSGLNEMYSVLKGIHKNDYTAEVAGLADLFSVTYDPAMIQIAIQDMVDYLNGDSVAKDHVVPVSVVDATNVDQFKGFGDAVSK